MRPIASLLAAAALTAAAACATQAVEKPSWRGPSLAHQQQLLGEAEEFMQDYARRLLAGDRAAIAALYDPDGAVLVRNGRRIVASHAEIVRLYAAETWHAPTSFEWRDLHFEAVGAESVIVLGGFVWGEANEPPAIGAYHVLLRRERGRLFIRIEDEAVDHSDS